MHKCYARHDKIISYKKVSENKSNTTYNASDVANNNSTKNILFNIKVIESDTML